MNSKRILIIDDDEVVVDIVQAMLENEGYEVCTAGNGFEANRQVFGANPPALILLDVMMPALSGGSIAEVYRANERTRSIPIVYLSGLPAAELDALVAQTGAAGYLSKPVSSGHLVKAVKRTIG